MYQSATLGTTPHGMVFSGAFTFGDSQRMSWVRKDDLIASQYESEGCSKFDDMLKRTNSQLKKQKRKSNLPQDEKMKAIKCQTPSVGSYNLSNTQVIDEDQLQFLLEKAKNNQEKQKLKLMYTIQSSIGKRLSGGDLDLHNTWIKHKPEIKDENPIGPGSYTLNFVDRQSQPIVGFGYKQDIKWIKEGPSPTQYYNSEIYSQFRTSSSWATNKKTGFGTSQKLMTPKTNLVGPGDYQNKSLDDGPKYTVPKGIRNLPSHKNVPAPNVYTPQLQNLKHSYSFGHKYFPIYTTDYYDPGPGAHDPKLPLSSNAKEIKFPKQLRSELVTKESLIKPGPGQHNQTLQPSKISHSKSQIAMGTANRHNVNTEFRLQRDRIPSPGRYDHNSSLQGPHYSIRFKNEQSKSIETPGPGFYEHDQNMTNESMSKSAFHYTISNTPHASLTKADRSDPVLSKYKNIGPGSYTLPQKSNQKAVMGKAARFPEKAKESIGPGSYYISGTIGIIPKYHFDKSRDRTFSSSFSQIDRLTK